MIFLRRTPAINEFDKITLRLRLHLWTSGWRGAFVLLTLAVIGITWWKGRDIYESVKVLRTEHLIAQSEAARERGDYNEAGAKLHEATALLQRAPITLRSVARYQVEMRDLSALNTCAELMKTGKATTEDKVFFACQAFRLGRSDLAGPVLEELKNSPGARDTAGVLAMQAGELAGDGNWPEALKLARQACVNPGDDQDLAFAKSVLARLLLRPPSTAQDAAPAFLSEGLSVLHSLALRKDAAGLEAMEELMRLSQNQPTAPLFLHWNVQALMEAAERHPRAGTPLRVGSWSLRLAAEPDQQAAIAQEFFERFRNDPSTSVRLEAARWLNQRGAHRLALDLAEPSKFESQDWLTLYLDATAALGNWEDVFRTLTARDQEIPLPTALRKLFELRSAAETGRHPDLAEAWRGIMAATRIESVENQLYVAGYAEQIGFPGQAAQIYARLLDQGGDINGAAEELTRPRRLACYTGLLRTGAGAMMLEELRTRVAAFALEFPEIDEVQNDDAYLQLLTGGDLDKAEKTAERLLQKRPQLLAYRTTMALSDLRRRKPEAAAALYEGWSIDWSTAQDQYKAVYAAVMRAAGRTADAEKVVETINAQALRPEERLLAGLP